MPMYKITVTGVLRDPLAYEMGMANYDNEHEFILFRFFSEDEIENHEEGIKAMLLLKLKLSNENIQELQPNTVAVS